MDRYIGELLDNRYEIIERIGIGGMAVVYKAKCHRLNRLVAVKILKEEFSKDDEFRRRFYAESQAVAMLSHPNIVSVYDVSHSEHLDYIVMELIEGITLKQYMEQKGMLSWREALHFSLQIAKALQHAHSRGIIHRDIKPHNIMVLKDGSVKVADFGIARITNSQSTLTREALGSVHYISPEQAKGQRVDCRADIYSLGVVMYEMLTGQPPYDADTPVSVALQHISGKAVLPRTLNPAVPLGMEQITMHAMESDLNRRYASAEELAADLEQYRKDPNMTFLFGAAADDLSVTEQKTAPAAKQEKPAVSENKKGSQNAPAAKKEQTSPEAQKKNEKKGNRVAVIAGIVCIALAVFAIGYFLFHYFISDLFQKTEEAEVPSLVGSYADSIDDSKYPDFIIEIANWVENDQYDYGVIINQEPKSGRMAKVGSKIKLTVSMGAVTNVMPPLVNLSQQNAKSYLDSMSIDLMVNMEYQYSDVFAEGYVMETVPSAKEVLSDGQSVTLVVSLGPETELVEVPSVVGEDIEVALDMISQAGLTSGSLRYDDSDLPKGTVIFQSIDPGTSVKEKTVVNLHISNGPIEAQKPVVKELSSDTEVNEGDLVILSIAAQTDDEGILTYAWYVSESGSVDDAVVVSRNKENNTSYTVDTTVPGTYYYFCKVVNTLEDSKESTDSGMICVTVKERPTPTRKQITVELPDDGEVHTVSVHVDGIEQIKPFEVDLSQEESNLLKLEVVGLGEQKVEIYLDGAVYGTQKITF